jgi:hypothetical protein
MTVSRLVAFVALAFCFVAGYFVADLWSRRGTSPLAQICARVDYANGLQENLKDAASDEVRTELWALAEQCRTALRIVLTNTTRTAPSPGFRGAIASRRKRTRHNVRGGVGTSPLCVLTYPQL